MATTSLTEILGHLDFANIFQGPFGGLVDLGTVLSSDREARGGKGKSNGFLN